MTTWSRFFIKLMITPYTGPRAKAPSRAGRSEKSILTKDGMSIGSGNSMNIRIKATALSMAATVRLRVVFFFMVISSRGVLPQIIDWKAPFAWFGTGKTIKNAPCRSKHCNRARRQIVLPAVSCIRTIPLAPESHRVSTLAGGRGLYRQWGISPRPETNFLAKSITRLLRLVNPFFICPARAGYGILWDRMLQFLIQGAFCHDFYRS
jgi:hypothetical protein